MDRSLTVAAPGNLPTHRYPHPTITSQTRTAGSIRGRGGRRCKRRFGTNALTANTDTIVPPPQTPFKATDPSPKTRMEADQPLAEPVTYRFRGTSGGRDRTVPSSLKVVISSRSGETSTLITVLVPPTTIGYARFSSTGSSA